MEVLEGRQSVFAALEARRRKFDVVLVKHGTHAESIADILALTELMNVPVRYVDSKELDSLAHGATHGGVLAVATSKPRLTINDLNTLVSQLTKPLLVLLEGVDDARNLGFTIRSAEALGVHAILIKKHLWDFDAVEIARPASGAYERLPLVQIDDVAALKDIQRMDVRLFGCLAGVRRTIYDVDLAQPCLLAIGGEKRGLSGAMRDICDAFIAIPSIGGATSLSLSHAGAIVMSEAMRQRRKL